MKITVTVAEPYLSQIGGVADQLRSAGMEIDQVLDALGMITGSVSAGRLAAVEALDGVASVDQPMGFELPDPGDEVQ
ncbi:hypothetical protein [Arthrobacter castelli]|uniref:hypothetical protein n=1 Tax=Arthrobacter castelli TaxID=271431 RepID=UPI0003FF6111|nr:hypothetical protein [Arthrobacter castelli]